MKRPPLIVVLLVASLGVVAVLAEQAYVAVRSHRAMAENVLRGYAALAADEYTRRATTELGFFGYFQAITALSEAEGRREGGALPSPSALAAHAGDETKRALALARTFYRYDPASGRLDTSGAELSRNGEAWLRRELADHGAEPLAANRRYNARYARIDGVLCAFVTLPAAPAPAGPKAALGFAVDRDALRDAFRRALARGPGPLLPVALGGGAIGQAISLSLVDPFGEEMFRMGPPFRRALGAEKTLGPDYGGILEGFVLRTSIDEAAAPKLAIGGLPRSRLPLLVSLMALTVGLVLAAAHLLRQERALGRMRADFVSRVSHELRTPLTQIRMFAETLLLDRVRSEEERVRYLAIIDREARRLSHLVENVLRFSRTERGDVRLAPRAHDLGPMVRDLLEEFRPLAAGSGASLALEAADGAVASVDDDALRQVLLNLLDNAVKYGPAGQEVRVGVTPGDGGVRVWVDDEGPGIPPRDRERIWRRFFRLDMHRESAVAGTGIGLTVVRDLVKRQGGRSWVEGGERGGARFVVEFPS